ncbi:MAG: hypothetical protein Ct9H300mP21_03270 [Pseudomonadota bacterium]|nr:MAG: hypothetical protein Ct9H300mP21_03270 [Pseudomonadota bacterium]
MAGGLERKRQNNSSTTQRQAGCALSVLEGLTVANPETLEPVPGDGETMGEVLMQGNIVMKGYFKNPKATAQAFAGWFHSGDIGVNLFGVVTLS